LRLFHQKSHNDFVNICMVTFNRLEFTQKAIHSIVEYTRYPYVLTVIDNNSNDGTKEYLLDLKKKEIIDNLILIEENIGVAKASNIGWLLVPEADYYMKFDNDIVIEKYNWLTNMVRVINIVKELGMIGYNFEIATYPLIQKEGENIRVKDGTSLGGACVLIPKRTRDLLGYWSEEYGLYGEEDADYGERVNQSNLLNAYMDDEDIGIHLPAGKAALIDEVSYDAADGVEESLHRDYRTWKDQMRRENVANRAFLNNIWAYKMGHKSLYYYPNHAIKYVKKNFPKVPVKVPKHRILNLMAYYRRKKFNYYRRKNKRKSRKERSQ